MENNNNSQLSFPQKYWWLLCIIVCFASPIAWHFIRRATHHSKEMIQIDNTQSSTSPTNVPPDSLHH